MSQAFNAPEHTVTPDDVRDVFDREGETPPEDTDALNAAIDAAVVFAAPRIYDRVTEPTFNTVVAYLAADYLFADPGEGGEKKKVQSGSEAVTYFESGDKGGKFAEGAEKWDTSNRLFTKTVGGFII